MSSLVGNMRARLTLDAASFKTGLATAGGHLKAFASRAASVMAALGGITAIVVIVGALIGKFFELVRAAGGFGNAISLLKDLAAEVWERIKVGLEALGWAFKAAGAALMSAFTGAFAWVIRKFANFTQTIAGGLNDLFGAMGVELNLTGVGGELADDLEQSSAYNDLRAGQLSGMAGSRMMDAIAPLKSLQAIKDVLEGVKEEGGGASAALDKVASSSGSTERQDELDEIKGKLDEVKSNAEKGAGAISDMFMGLVTKTQTLKGALADLAGQIAKTFAQRGFMALANMGGGTTSFLAGLGSLIGGNANGTPNWRGGPTYVNERGGEIIDLPSGSRIIPHDISSQMARQSGSRLSVGVSIDGGGNLLALVRDQAGQVVAQATQGIVGDAVGAVRAGARRSSKFLGV